MNIGVRGNVIPFKFLTLIAKLFWPSMAFFNNSTLFGPMEGSLMKSVLLPGASLKGKLFPSHDTILNTNSKSGGKCY